MAGEPTRDETRRAPAAKRLGETIYATVILMSVLTYISEDTTDPVEILAVVGGTAVVLLLTRWYAELVADIITYGKPPGRRAGRRILSEAVPLVEVAIVPVLLLLFAVLKILGVEWSINIALLIGAFSLAGFGFVRARRSGAGLVGTVFITASTLGLGFLLIILKAMVH
jgi:hypothetical protein